MVIVEAEDEATAAAHFQAIVNGAATASIQEVIPGVYVSAAQQSGRYWRFSGEVRLGKSEVRIPNHGSY